MKRNVLFVLLLITALISCNKEHNNLPDGLYAEIETNKGSILLELDYKKAPVTVANFITLAEGENEYIINDTLKGKPFFNGLKFHRVIKEFMIQTGDPLGTGSGDTGYKFKDEFSDLRFDKGGILAMANNGAGTNSCQFFITHLETPWLDGKHTIFGHTVDYNLEIVNKIEQDDFIKSITIIRNGEDAKKFNAIKVFHDYFQIESESQKQKIAAEAAAKKEYEIKYKAVCDEKAASFTALKSKASKTSTGLQYAITKKGNSKKPAAGTNVYIHYAGFLENGTLFDSSLEDVSKTFGKFDPARAAAKQYVPIPFQIGRKDGLIPGFIEGIEKMAIGDKAVIFIPSHLGYGEAGAGDVIPPNTNIIFELELMDKMPN
jgi:cyclophilin family peptidyl-prolyl cis-trans isomerase